MTLTRVSGEAFQGQRVLMPAFGCTHVLAVTDNGSLWSWVNGRFGSLNHNEFIKKLVLMRV